MRDLRLGSVLQARQSSKRAYSKDGLGAAFPGARRVTPSFSGGSAQHVTASVAFIILLYMANNKSG